ncbi:MAG: esterase/lipase family protein [Acidiferrobacterales bacterium]
MRRYLVILLVLAIAGCTVTSKKPDLKRLYAVSSADRFQNPVILVHGALASRLRTMQSGKEIWPGPWTNFLFDRLGPLALEIDPASLQARDGHAKAYALFDGFAGRHYYDRIRDALEDAGGYTFSRPGEPNRATQRYYIFLYDWRQDLVQSAALLDDFIDQIRRDHDDAHLRIDIVAHSMGALLTRYYLRYGDQDVLDSEMFTPNYRGAAKVRRVVLIGAPNMGSITALQTFMTGHKFGAANLYPEMLATMPSAYQLLPHPERDWMITIDGKKWRRDLYSVQTWREYRWSVFNPDMRERIRKRFENDDDAEQYLSMLERYFARNLQRAKRFHRAISLPVEGSPVRFIVFGGDCILTPARCLVENVNGESLVRLFPHEISRPLRGVDYRKLMLEPGDGRVTKPSLLARNALDPSVPATEPGAFGLAYAVLLCDSHSGLTANITFQDNLLNILLTQETTEDRVNRQELPRRKEQPAGQPPEFSPPELG